MPGTGGATDKEIATTVRSGERDVEEGEIDRLPMERYSKQFIVHLQDVDTPETGGVPDAPARASSG
jgi:hypothetical protein